MKTPRSVLLVVALSALAVAGCTGQSAPPKTVSASSLTGQTLAQVYSTIGYTLPSQPPPDLGVITYDMTGLVTGDPGPAGQPQPDWTVVASCWTDAPAPNGAGDPLPRIVLGTVPTRYATPEVLQDGRQGAFRTTLAECREQTPDTFSVTAP